MESWLRLSREQTQLKITRQKRRRYLFWSIGLILVAVQVVIAIYASRSSPAALAQSATAAVVVQTTAVYTQTSAMHTATLPIAPLPSATPQPAQATLLPLPLATQMIVQTHTPPAPSSNTQSADASEPIQVARTVSGTFLSTGYSTYIETPAPTQVFSSLVLLAPPEQVTEQTFELSGTGEPGKEVFIFYNHSIIAQAQIDKHGDWRTDVSTAPLVRGDNVFVLTSFRQEPESGLFKHFWTPAYAGVTILDVSTNSASRH